MSLVYSRRDFGRLALAAFPAAAVAGRFHSALAFQEKPNSLWGGVPFGIFAPYRFGPEASDLDGALNALVKLGVSYTELTAAVVERYAGAPQAAGGRGGAGQPPAAVATEPPPQPAPMAIPCEAGVPSGAAATPGGGGRGQQSPEQQAAARAQAEALAKWRASVPMSKFADVRKKFNDAGVHDLRVPHHADQPDDRRRLRLRVQRGEGGRRVAADNGASARRRAREAHRPESAKSTASTSDITSTPRHR